MVRLILARHGETVWDKDKRLNGQSNVPLSPIGESQAKTLGEFLKSNYKPDLFFSSTLRRSIQTAGAVSEILGLPFNQVKEFNDIDCGSCTGMSYPEVGEHYPELVKEWKNNTDPPFPKGENMADVEKRAIEKLKDVIKLCKKDQTILIVSHAGINQAIIGWFLKIPPALRFKIKQSHVCINEISFDKNLELDRLIRTNFSPLGFVKIWVFLFGISFMKTKRIHEWPHKI